MTYRTSRGSDLRHGDQQGLRNTLDGVFVFCHGVSANEMPGHFWRWSLTFRPKSKRVRTRERCGATSTQTWSLPLCYKQRPSALFPFPTEHAHAAREHVGAGHGWLQVGTPSTSGKNKTRAMMADASYDRGRYTSFWPLFFFLNDRAP